MSCAMDMFFIHVAYYKRMKLNEHCKDKNSKIDSCFFVSSGETIKIKFDKLAALCAEPASYNLFT